MTSLVTWSQVGTAVGTLILAVATFAAVRSSAKATRLAEQSLLAGIRPVLAPAWPDDPAQQVVFADGHLLELTGDRPGVQATGTVIYLALPLRNLGTGLALLRGYRIYADSAEDAARDPQGRAGHWRTGEPAPDPGTFLPQQRDLAVATPRAGFWQAAIREPGSEAFRAAHRTLTQPGRLTIDLLYTDHLGGQPTITRMVLLPEQQRWRIDATRHWPL